MAGAVAICAALAFAFFSPLKQAVSSDDLTAAQKQQQTAAFEQAVAAGATIFTPVNIFDPDERAKAKAALGLADQEAERVMQAAEGGQYLLGWVTVWDNLAEDGDVVDVSSNGMTHRVPIRHKPTTIVVPYSAGTAELTLRGVHDGGGGITVSAKTEAGPLPLPPLAVGETKQLRFK